MTDNEKEMVATIKLSLLRAIVDLNEENLLNLVKKVLEETKDNVCKGCRYDDGKRKALEQEGYYKDLAQSYERTIVQLTEAIAEQHSEDCVSREAAQEAVENTIAKYIPILIGQFEKIPLELALAIKNLPPVTPARKKGEWIGEEEGYYSECSCCGASFLWEDYKCISNWKYCPICGAEMESEE